MRPDLENLIPKEEALARLFQRWTPKQETEVIPLADEPLDFSRLTGERFIAISESDGPALYNEIRHVCETRGFSPNVVCQYDRAEAVLLSVGAGTGIAIVPEAVASVFYSNNVKLKRIPGSDAIRTYVVAWHRNVTNPAAKLFLEVVRELFHTLP